jgi:hypothetical protein
VTTGSRPWWQGRYVIGATPWWATRPTRGAFTNFTSTEWVARYSARYGSTPSYQGVAPVGALCAVCDAIERAGSVRMSDVRTALESTQLDEFYGNVRACPYTHGVPALVAIRACPTRACARCVWSRVSSQITFSRAHHQNRMAVLSLQCSSTAHTVHALSRCISALFSLTMLSMLQVLDARRRSGHCRAVVKCDRPAHVPLAAVGLPPLSACGCSRQLTDRCGGAQLLQHSQPDTRSLHGEWSLRLRPTVHRHIMRV